MNIEISSDPILGKTAAAAAIGISVMTLDRLASAQKGPLRRQLSARRVGYRVSDIRAWVEHGVRCVADIPSAKPKVLQKKGRSPQRIAA